MKKNTITILCMCFIFLAQGYSQELKSKYLNIGYLSSSWKHESANEKLKTKFGFSLTAGKTYSLTSEPIADILYIGIDWSYIDANYSQLTSSFDLEDFSEVQDIDPLIGIALMGSNKLTKMEFGMQAGPSVSILPMDNLQLSAYLRYNPAYSTINSGELDEFSGGFGNFFVGGLAANYNSVGLGIESRWGSADHKSITEMVDNEADSYKIKTNGVRVYLSFRF